MSTAFLPLDLQTENGWQVLMDGLQYDTGRMLLDWTREIVPAARLDLDGPLGMARIIAPPGTDLFAVDRARQWAAAVHVGMQVERNAMLTAVERDARRRS